MMNESVLMRTLTNIKTLALWISHHLVLSQLFPGYMEEWTTAGWVEGWASLKWLTVNPTYGNTNAAATTVTTPALYTYTHKLTHFVIRPRRMPHFTNSRASERDAVIRARMNLKKKKKQSVCVGDEVRRWAEQTLDLEFITTPLGGYYLVERPRGFIDLTVFTRMCTVSRTVKLPVWRG